jgi:hypothetical protein
MKNVGGSLALLGLLLLFGGGCRMGGDTGVVDSDVEAGLLSFAVCDGTTTREEVLLRLGAPTAEFESSRIIVHRFLMGATRKKLVPISCGTEERVSTDRRLYDLVLVFDNEVVTRHRLVRVR